VITRSDLPLTDQAVQAGHAVATWVYRWYHTSLWRNETLVYLVVTDLAKLELLKRKMEALFQNFSASWLEPDLNNELTAIVCYTDISIFDNLKMLGA
jgi:hypothetical protein